mgnify:CR=1 FL=1
MKTKINKESRNLLIALLLGDGTISNNNVLKLSHCVEQEDYLKFAQAIFDAKGDEND